MGDIQWESAQVFEPNVEHSLPMMNWHTKYAIKMLEMPEWPRVLNNQGGDLMKIFKIVTKRLIHQWNVHTEHTTKRANKHDNQLLDGKNASRPRAKVLKQQLNDSTISKLGTRGNQTDKTNVPLDNFHQFLSTHRGGQ